ncbi:MAG: hypothetical protein Q8861_05980 [Bacteroidota bacterium]|nr:hypothetical protein [Bacteroidota bacterium]
MKKLLIYSFLLLLVACGSKKSDIPVPENATQYTFSLPHQIEFGVASGSYVVIYQYAQPLDTAFYYSNIVNIGKDTIVYAQARSLPDETGRRFDSKTKAMNGEVTALVLYDGKKIHYLKPPYFDPYFSAFAVEGQNIYYWGLNKDNAKTYACRYNLKTGATKAIYLIVDEGTDYFGAFYPPRIDESGILFKEDIGNQWVFDKAFDQMLKRIVRPEAEEEKDSVKTETALFKI